jgi:uncharacterized protein (TIGR02453 family)
MSTYFSPDFLQFFKELAANNHKEWFDENRKRYETVVKKPFEVFVQHAIDEMAKLDPRLSELDPKKCIFRINRDIRFSKDKAPYKLNRSAAISVGGRNDMIEPGIYFEIGPEHVRFYTGVYSPDKDSLMKVRKHIASNLKEFSSVITDKEFEKIWGEIQGDKNKIIDKSLKGPAETQALLYNKNFYVYCTYKAELVHGPILKEMAKAYKAAQPFMNFMASALKN